MPLFMPTLVLFLPLQVIDATRTLRAPQRMKATWWLLIWWRPGCVCRRLLTCLSSRRPSWDRLESTCRIHSTHVFLGRRMKSFSLVMQKSVFDSLCEHGRSGAGYARRIGVEWKNQQVHVLQKSTERHEKLKPWTCFSPPKFSFLFYFIIPWTKSLFSIIKDTTHYCFSLPILYNSLRCQSDCWTLGSLHFHAFLICVICWRGNWIYVFICIL